MVTQRPLLLVSSMTRLLKQMQLHHPPVQCLSHRPARPLWLIVTKKYRRIRNKWAILIKCNYSKQLVRICRMLCRIHRASYPSLNSFSFNRLLNSYRPLYQAHRLHLHLRWLPHKYHSNKSSNSSSNPSKLCSNRRREVCKIRCKNFILVKSRCSSWITNLAVQCRGR